VAFLQLVYFNLTERIAQLILYHSLPLVDIFFFVYFHVSSSS